MKRLLTEDQLREGVQRLAHEIGDSYAGRPLTIVGILTGSVVLLADLIRELNLPLRVGVVQARSYHGATTERGELIINSDLMPDIKDRDVLLVDDIFDTGHTLVEVVAKMRELQPRSIRSLVLFRKEGRQQVKHAPDFVGFSIPDKFVVGYGLDYEDAYRHLPYLAALEENEINDHPLDGERGAG
ncbi:MAG: hypoxanthine phosphoribosyltransferase [Planctomycetaceae bacterium]|nr:hypoxanthine phosphoribosyltransferase [Planctomycetaceae bacterium]